MLFFDGSKSGRNDPDQLTVFLSRSINIGYSQ